MELLQLRYFKDAAELENFSEVAKKNMVPQPSISKTISKLENELGVKLFDRHGKKIVLNSDGKFFYMKINEALTNIDAGIEHFNKVFRTNIAIYVQAGNRFLSLLTADFRTSSRDIFISSVNTSSNNSKPDYDFTFMQLLPDMSDYNFEPLMNDEIVLVVSKNNPICKLDSVSIKELSTHKYIGYYKSINLRDFTDDYCRRVGGFTPGVVFETHDDNALRYMIEKDSGIALMPQKFFSLQPSDKLKVIPLKEKTSRTIVIAWNKNHTLSKPEIQFKDFSKKWFANL